MCIYFVNNLTQNFVLTQLLSFVARSMYRHQHKSFIFVTDLHQRPVNTCVAHGSRSSKSSEYIKTVLLYILQNHTNFYTSDVFINEYFAHPF
jgi:hypothetical protein